PSPDGVMIATTHPRASAASPASAIPEWSDPEAVGIRNLDQRNPPIMEQSPRVADRIATGPPSAQILSMDSKFLGRSPFRAPRGSDIDDDLAEMGAGLLAAEGPGQVFQREALVKH